MPFWEKEWWEDAGNVTDVAGSLLNPFGYGTAAAGKHYKKMRDGSGPSDADMSAERMQRMYEGMAQGRQMGERIYGQGQEQTGADVQDVIQRRRQRLDRPSYAAESIRRSGQQEKRYAASKGASDAQKQNVAYQSAMAAGAQEDMDYERRLQDFQSLVGNIAGTQSALELGGGQLGLASQYIAPPRQSTGILSAFGLV